MFAEDLSCQAFHSFFQPFREVNKTLKSIAPSVIIAVQCNQPITLYLSDYPGKWNHTGSAAGWLGIQQWLAARFCLVLFLFFLFSRVYHMLLLQILHYQFPILFSIVPNHQGKYYVTAYKLLYNHIFWLLLSSKKWKQPDALFRVLSIGRILLHCCVSGMF